MSDILYVIGYLIIIATAIYGVTILT